MRIRLAQINSTVGDIAANTARIREVIRASAKGTDLIVFPEMCVTGYPPLDLVERPAFIEAAQFAIQSLAANTRDFPEVGVIIGAPTPNPSPNGKRLFNSAILLADGGVRHLQPKSLLPTYDVFDEARHFEPAPSVEVVSFKGERLGISVCEDYWNAPQLWPQGRLYSFDPIAESAVRGATLLINISASPYSMGGKDALRYEIMRTHARRHGLPFVGVNLVGANDELVFDGLSMALNAQGNVIAVAEPFVECVTTCDVRPDSNGSAYTPLEDIPSLHTALSLGIRDYMRKTGFHKAVVGLSGGIDSAVTAQLAVSAVGANNVTGVTMPSPFSSPESVTDAAKLSENLGVRHVHAPISGAYEAFLRALNPLFPNWAFGVAHENIQARIRGNILMAFSNTEGSLVLSTGNKSELAVGYCTLYGDMSGGISPLADVPKTLVYQLARFVNREREVIPIQIIAKPASAELRPNQRDQDTLPPYEILDGILEAYIEDRKSALDITALGFDGKIVDWVIRAVERNEYKRRQAAPGLKVASKSFGPGRRMPIAAHITSLPVSLKTS